MSEEGEFKKRLKRPYNELFWKRFAYTHRKEDGSFPQQDEYIDSILEDAKRDWIAIHGIRELSMYHQALRRFGKKWLGVNIE